ncbi:MAG: gamma-glutamylcyclotransferase family protein [Gemmataceae bacterium]
MNDRLFFYGTLLPDLARPPVSAVIARLTPLGPATVSGLLYDLGPYPGLVAGDGIVCGELFAGADVAVLTILDAYEGYDPHDVAGSLFRRERATTLDAWVYMYNRDMRGAEWIPSGGLPGVAQLP